MQNVFDSMGGVVGPIFGIIFYLLVVLAAVSSSISLLETVVTHFVDSAAEKGKGDKRKFYSFIASVAIAVLCLLGVHGRSRLERHLPRQPAGPDW